MGATYAGMKRAALAAEGAGFDGIWTWDHLRDTDGSAPTPECWTTLSALAEAVPRVMLGPLVLNVANRRPGVLANMAATLQEVSGGRLLLGIGAGGSMATPYRDEQQMLGHEVGRDGERAARTAEAIQVMKRLWAGDRSGFEGEHYRLARPSGFLQPEPPPPVIVGGFGPRMAAVAGTYGDGFNTPANHPDLERLAAIGREAFARSGRDASTFLLTVFAGLSERLLRPGSPERVRLEGLGVARLILLVSPPFDEAQIADAGRLLGAR
jgi:alkanesulfonate monooxygenase SsuD/methylene tetrahydromethanopterin reductase-like flavin-dependent oxidoreductase (luciferase family)